MVKVTWNLDALIQEIAKKCRGELNPGRAVDSGKVIFDACERERRQLAASVHRRLSSVASDFEEGRSGGESVVMDFSYLVEKEKEHLFDQIMQELGRENKDYITFRYTGPLPPTVSAIWSSRRGIFRQLMRQGGFCSFPREHLSGI